MMKEKLWKFTHKDNIPSTVEEVKEIIFSNRNLISESEKFAFLNPDIHTINFDIGDIEAMVDRIIDAIHLKKKITVYGDYDADGVTATAILWETLAALGADALPYIPHREKEGYGMSVVGIDAIIETQKADIIITVDQGISARKQVEYAQSKGIEVLITDHHTKPPLLPEKCLIVHDHHVCGAGVSWKVATRLLQKFHDNKQISNDLIDIDTAIGLPNLSKRLLELVAIGMICDLVPLIGEARTLTIQGLKQLKQTERIGLKALYQSAGIIAKDVDTYHVGYLIGPRINATGRLNHAMDSLRLLCTKDVDRAKRLAEQVNVTNEDRKELTQSLINEAHLQIEEQKANKIYIVGNENWNPGIIGLVASKMVESYYRPTIAWGATEDNKEIYKASARSINGFNIIEAISLCSENLLNHGGHPMAAGLSVKKTSNNDFIKKITSYANTEISTEILTPNLRIDCELPENLLDYPLYDSLCTLKPFGTQSEEPIFVSKQMKVVESRAIGNENKHLKLKLAQKDNPKKQIDGIAFNFGELNAKLRPNELLNVAYHLDVNEWNGKKNIQLKIRDIKLT